MSTSILASGVPNPSGFTALDTNGRTFMRLRDGLVFRWHAEIPDVTLSAYSILKNQRLTKTDIVEVGSNWLVSTSQDVNLAQILSREPEFFADTRDPKVQAFGALVRRMASTGFVFLGVKDSDFLFDGKSWRLGLGQYVATQGGQDFMTSLAYQHKVLTENLSASVPRASPWGFRPEVTSRFTEALMRFQLWNYSDTHRAVVCGMRLVAHAPFTKN